MTKEDNAIELAEIATANVFNSMRLIALGDGMGLGTSNRVKFAIASDRRLAVASYPIDTPNTEIARALGVSESTIRNDRKALGSQNNEPEDENPQVDEPDPSQNNEPEAPEPPRLTQAQIDASSQAQIDASDLQWLSPWKGAIHWIEDLDKWEVRSLDSFPEEKKKLKKQVAKAIAILIHIQEQIR